MVVSLLVPTMIGYFWLDPKFDRAPLFTLIGLGIGTVIAFYGLIRMLRRYRAEQNPKEGKK
jgi:F0F1-type ATP synthase assembly protein I